MDIYIVAQVFVDSFPKVQEIPQQDPLNGPRKILSI